MFAKVGFTTMATGLLIVGGWVFAAANSAQAQTVVHVRTADLTTSDSANVKIEPVAYHYYHSYYRAPYRVYYPHRAYYGGAYRAWYGNPYYAYRPYYYAPSYYAPSYYAPSYYAPSYYAPSYYAPYYAYPYRTYYRPRVYVARRVVVAPRRGFYW